MSRVRELRLRDLPSVYVGIGVAYVLVRVVAVVGTTVAGSYPDTPTYRYSPYEPTYRLVSLSGHAMRPWVPPLLFAVVPSDSGRSAAQVALSIGAWLALAATVAYALRDRRLRVAAFVVVLVFSCTTAVTSWDRIIGSESTSISFAVLALAAWIRFAAKATPLNSVAVVLAMIGWTFTKAGTFPVVGLTAVVVSCTMASRRDRLARGLVSGALVLVATWACVANSNSDTTYEAFHGQGLSQFNINFELMLRLDILNHPKDTAWFVAHGMPDPADLTGHVLRSPVDLSWAVDEDAELDAYVRRRDLVAWGNGPARKVFAQFVATHPGRTVARFSDALPYLIVPPKGLLIYDSEPRVVLPEPASNLFFATSSGPGPPRSMLGDLGLLVVVCAGLALVRRRRVRDHRLLFVAGAAFALGFVALIFGWVLSPIEIVRHALPATIVLRLALWITAFALADALLPDREVMHAHHE